MKLTVCVVAVTVSMLLVLIRWWLRRMAEPWSKLFDHLGEGGPDYRWAGPTLECLCGSDMLGIIASFDENRCVATYFTDARCMHCGAYLIAPTEAD